MTDGAISINMSVFGWTCSAVCEDSIKNQLDKQELATQISKHNNDFKHLRFVGVFEF